MAAAVKKFNNQPIYSMLMKRNKWILMVNGALLSLFAACSADAPVEMVQDDGRVEIRVNSSILSSVEPGYEGSIGRDD